ncbi:hypothetical protein [Novosphingobium sp.]|uniref:hypothetical protein n=1 Tax=Novosphingobium sp. TaxID=1874826 RepID=UPI0025D242F0|nr:hypothetical protein [Novosphingobium sp.]MCC6926792.1 hypothetical protein [Novosphingobium sp.]
MDPALGDRLLKALVGKPMVSNAFRGTLVEAMLAGVLEPEWRWQADGWGSFDFEGPGGVGLEIKQSAARQDWHDSTARPNRGRFDIAARSGRWEGASWIQAPGRAAAIYVFAWHPMFDPAKADHRNPRQWQFHIVSAADLPDQKSIALSGVQALAQPCDIDGLKTGLNKMLETLR